MELALPLSQQQVDCACRVHKALKQWRLAESTLEMLASRFPDFSDEACLLKTVAVNDIYGTQLFATVRMAKHIQGIFDGPGMVFGDVDLVDRIARLPANQGDKPRLAVSFASKFCHFFVDAEKFPIFDEAARVALEKHLGRDGYVVDKAKPYQAFCRNFRTLRELAKLESTTKELDQYLWLTGMFMRWQKEKSKKNPRVNAELKAVFQDPSPEIMAELRAMLPKDLAAQVGQGAAEH